MLGLWQQVNRELLDTFGKLDQSLTTFIDELVVENELLSPEQQFEAAQEAFLNSARLAQEGNVLEARRVEERARLALDLATKNFGSGELGAQARESIVGELKLVRDVLERLSDAGLEGIKVNARGFAVLKDATEINTSSNYDTAIRLLLGQQRTVGFEG